MPAPPNWNQMVALLIQLGSNHAKTRGRGSCGARHHSQRVAPPKLKKEGRTSSARLLKESHVRKPLGKTLISFNWLGGHISKCTTLITTMKDPMTSPTPSVKMATSTGLMGSDVHEIQEAWTEWKNLQFTHHMAVKSSPKDIHFFLGGPSYWIVQDHRLKGNPFPWLPSQASEVVLLSMVQTKKDRTKVQFWATFAQATITWACSVVNASNTLQLALMLCATTHSCVS